MKIVIEVQDAASRKKLEALIKKIAKARDARKLVKPIYGFR